MRTFATLKNFTSSDEKAIILRNLNRILDIVVLDMDSENGTITFLHASKTALDRAEHELKCIGFPITSLNIGTNEKPKLKASGLLT